MEATNLRLFLASPGGLEEYRAAARRTAEAVRRDLAEPLGVGFDLVGWEDLPPGFGRPQGRINPSLDRCNVLIGILGRRLGSPTGAAISGFVEEFERMAERAKAGEEVEIMIYMTELSAEELEDPGEKLRAVLEFRERLQREVLFKSIRGPDHLAAELGADLLTLVAPAAARGAGGTAEEAGPPPREEPVAEAALPPAAADGPAGEQLRALLEEASALVPGIPERFGAEPLPLPRLALWLSTWQAWYVNNETFDHHGLNRLYRVRGEAELGALERRQVLRSMCGQPSLAPGWALLGESPDGHVPGLLAIGFAEGEDPLLRAGAWDLVEAEALRAWFAGEGVEIEEERFFERLLERADEFPDGVRLATIRLAGRVAGDPARGFLVALRERDDSPDQALAALIELEAGFDPAAAFALASETEGELWDAPLEALRMAAAGAPLESLEDLAGAPAPAPRSLAIELLGARGTEAAPILARLAEDPDAGVALAAFSALSALPAPEVDMAPIEAELATREGLRFDVYLRRVGARGRSADELRSRISWIETETAGAYRALAEEHFEEFGETVRRDLGDGFETFAAESRERMLATLDPAFREAVEKAEPERVVVEGETQDGIAKTLADFRELLEGGEWNESRFAPAALAGIAAAGGPGDAALVRPYLDAKDIGIREAAAGALATVGEEADVARLVELAQGRDGEPFARAAVAISPGPGGAAQALLDSSRAGSAMVAARHLYGLSAELDETVVEGLLHHGIDGVRRVAVAVVLERLGEDTAALESLLDRYLGAESYFYDVVVLLDRILYAPEAIGRRARAEVAAFAAEPKVATERLMQKPLMRALRQRVLKVNQ